MASSYLEFWLMNKATYGKFDNIMRSVQDEIEDKKQIQHFTLNVLREVNEDNVLVRNVLVEFEDSLKYVSNMWLGFSFVNDLKHWVNGTDSTASPPGQVFQLTWIDSKLGTSGSVLQLQINQN